MKVTGLEMEIGASVLGCEPGKSAGSVGGHGSDLSEQQEQDLGDAAGFSILPLLRACTHLVRVTHKANLKKTRAFFNLKVLDLTHTVGESDSVPCGFLLRNTTRLQAAPQTTSCRFGYARTFRPPRLARGAATITI